MWIGFCRKMKVEAFTFVCFHKWVDNVCRDGNGLVVHFEKTYPKCRETIASETVHLL
jgi:hypothetical protein